MGALVGRAADIVVAETALDQAGLRVLEIVGEPGIGKTRLLAEIGVLAANRGHRVLAGHAGELTGTVPFAVFVDAIDDELAGRQPPLDRRSLTLLAGVVPALADFAPAESTMGAERFRVHRALGDLLGWLATPNGLVLTLDDMHWSDEATAELLARLLRHPPDGDILIVLAYRPRQRPAHLAAALGAGTIITLEPLSVEQTAELLGPDVGLHQVNRLYELSGGNPLYLDALSKADNMVSFDAVLHAEFAVLPEQVKVVAHAAAALDDPFELDVVAKVAKQTRAHTEAALAELVARDLVWQQGNRWRYRHPLVRRAAYRSALRGWLHGAHARAAHALADAPPAKRAPHLMRVANAGDEESIEVLTEAARGALAYGPATAAQWLRAAVDLLPENESGRRLELLAELGHALALSGSLHAGRDVLQSVLHQLPASEPARRAAAVVSCARVEQLLGRHPEARGLLLGELHRMPATNLRERALLALEMGTVGLISCDFQIDRSWITDALEIARTLGDPTLEAGAYAVLALAAYGAADVHTALEWQRKGARLVDELPDKALASRLDVTATLGWAELYLAQPRAGLRHLERGLALSARTGQSHQLTYLLTGKAMAQQVLGELADAGVSAAEAVEAAELSMSDKLRAAAYTIQGMIAISRRDRDLALRSGELAAAACAEHADWWAAVAGCTLGGARLINGDIDGSVDDLVRLAGGPGLPLLDQLHRPVFGSSLVLAELARGRKAEAREWIDLMERSIVDSAGGELLANRTGHLALCRARVHLAEGDPAAAAEQAGIAAFAFESIDHVLNQAESREVLGDARFESGDTEAAIAELTWSAKLYDACGTTNRRDGVYRALRKLGASTAAPSQPGQNAALPQLTAREAEVAELVANGLTNREIMRRLSLSRRTVETHISNIRLKLAVTSRAALAAAVTRALRRPG